MLLIKMQLEKMKQNPTSYTVLPVPGTCTTESFEAIH